MGGRGAGGGGKGGGGGGGNIPPVAQSLLPGEKVIKQRTKNGQKEYMVKDAKGRLWHVYRPNKKKPMVYKDMIEPGGPTGF